MTNAVLDQLHSLEARSRELKDQQKRILDSLATAAQQELSVADRELKGAGALPQQPTIAEDAEVLVAELCSLQTCQLQAQHLQEVQSQVRQLDKQLRLVQRAGGQASVQSLVEAVGGAVAAYSAVLPPAIRLRQVLTDSTSQLPGIADAADALFERIAAAQGQLREAVEAQLAARLEQLHWPPPLTPGGDASDRAGGWAGFGAAPAGVLDDVMQLMTSLTQLQRAVEEPAFQAVLEGSALEGPLLWAVSVFAKPLGQKLRLHFAAGLPTDRPDKPEWLFGTALRMVHATAHEVGQLQGTLDALALGEAYSVQFEMARAVREEVKVLLREHLVPALEAGDQPALWTHLFDEALTFERQLAPLRGLALDGDDDAVAAVPAACVGAVTGVLFEEPAWSSAWFAAELAAASAQLEAVLDSDAGWQPAATAWGGGEAGEESWDVPSPSDTATRQASQHEFWPPLCAEALVSTVTGLVRRSAWCDSSGHRRQFLKQVPQQLLKAFRARLQRTGKMAEEYRDLIGVTWAPRLGACVCAAHFLEHTLREPEVMVLLDTDAAGPSGAPYTSGAQSGTATPASLFSPASIGSYQSFATTAANGGGGGGGGGSLTSILERESSAFGWLKREWTLKMAKALATQFTDAARSYRQRLDRFEVHGEAGGDGVLPPVSPAFVSALELLRGNLTRLAGVLDCCVLRDCWRAMAVAANRMLFNEVATEARFTQQGALQLCADVEALVACFAPYTPRPAAHFKEIREACALLTLPPDALQLLINGMDGAADGGAAALSAAGVHRLNPQQAAAVLAQRLE